MIDHCIVGDGIVGKYMSHLLRGKNTSLVSGQHPQYETSPQYPIDQYIGERNTWREKAAGIVSFPSKQDVTDFPFTWEQYQQYSRELISELGLASMASLADDPTISPAVQALQQMFPDTPMQFFWSGHKPPLGPSFTERAAYGKYWLSHKPTWPFLEQTKPIAQLQAQYLEVKNGMASRLVTTDTDGKVVNVDAEHYVLACHTPGTLDILRKTWNHNNLPSSDRLGQHYADHPQTSLGLLLPGIDIPRTTLPAICYQDREYRGIPFRLEFHFTPPRENLVAKTRERLRQYTEEDFAKHFVRLAIVYHIPPKPEHKLIIHEKEAQISEAFLKTCEALRAQILPHVRDLLKDQPVIVLNQHTPFYFAGHLTGGISYPHVVDKSFQLREIPNVTIAGCGVFPTSGLFNPVFSSLICAKHAVADQSHC